MTERAVILSSSISTDQIQIINSRRLETAFQSKNLVFDIIDGAMPDVKDIRDQLFAISNLRGKYPQCFIMGDDGFRFVGQWEEVESLLDCDALPADVLAANPNIPTFSKVFEHVARTA